MRRRIILIVLLILLLLGAGAAWFFFFYQPSPIISDETEGGQAYFGDGGDERENEGVLNKNVHVFMDEDADDVNAAVKSVEYGDDELILKFAENTENGLTGLGTGDIFWLEGGDSTPLQDTYIGKVVSNTIVGEERFVSIESPMIDEVFDQLYLDNEFQISAADIENIYTVEGVTITPVAAIQADFMEDADTEPSENATEVQNMSAEISKKYVGSDSTVSADLGSIILNINADLTELLDALEDGKQKSSEEDEENDKKKISAEAGTKCKVTGKLGLEDLKLKFTFDFDKEQYGIRELSAGVSGKQVLSAGIELGLSGEVSGKTTQEQILSFIKLQGLKQKVFPIAYFDCSYNAPVYVSGIGNTLNKNIEKRHEFMPLSCGFMVYIDIYGNLSLEMTAEYEYTNKFENKFVLVKDGNFIHTFEGNEDEPTVDYRVEVKAAADADVHLGTSALLYFFNINLVDVGIVKAGGEIQGNGSLKVSAQEETDEGLNASFYARIYAKILDIKACLKLSAKLWGFHVDAALEWEGTLLDLTVFETGQKRDTHFNEQTMSWEKMTAEDEEAFYYKGTNGKLLRESKNLLSRDVIYEGDFFSICGLDQSYIYVLEPVEDESYNVRRISKDGTVTKVILEDVKYILRMEEDVFYYVPSFTDTQIYKLDRSTLKKEKFMEFDENVEIMAEEEENFLIATQEEDAFSWLVGPDIRYYLVTVDGVEIAMYEDDLTPQQCVKDDLGEYYVAFEIISNGYLRETASRGYWLSADENFYVEAEGISGWHPTEVGILTELDNENGDYNVILYQASDGNPRIITTVNSRTAFFTFVQDKSGNWYYMDQTDTELELYRMDPSFTSKTKIATVSLEEIPCNMEACSMEIVENRIFFYTMPSWSESEVLYRYNLY
ncbi:hypothetical protein B5F07_08680 [Lachnoclostridium sp. An169]|uniref:hypothetical protein n=1 Tax=Lachnoclostridium sp. An169 TaxID=1965569 RepID=UPI000B395452|nr:hypothetical protein [Lachnoclostridium sp. An169]OUP84201.1 hypothetical protein B5F07_08680 [Lachnoclostridium sp. An169]